MKQNTGNHLRAFVVKYLPHTQTMGSRVKITDKRTRESKTIGYDYEYDNALEIACNYLEGIGMNIVSHGDLGDCYVVMSDSWAYKTQDEFVSVKG